MKISKLAAKVGIIRYDDESGLWCPRWEPRVERHHRVYFIRAGEAGDEGAGPVKIGFSTNVGERLKQLQTASPVRLTLVRLIIGTPALEAETHRRLKRHGLRIRGEWYTMSSDDIQWIIVDLFDDGLVQP